MATATELMKAACRKIRLQPVERQSLVNSPASSRQQFAVCRLLVF